MKTPVQTFRAVQWGHWGITFFHAKAGTRDAASFEGQLMFPVGSQGPIDGYIGSPMRQGYIDACKSWVDLGILPDGTVCELSQKWLYAPKGAN